MTDESELKESFESASLFVRTISGSADKNDLLYLYARFKQANEGPCNVARPGMFDFQGKQKWDAWKSLADKSKTDSMLEYIDKLSDIDPDWQLKIESGKVKPQSGMGVAVSTLHRNEDTLADDAKTVFDWCQEGNSNKVVELLTNRQLDINECDDTGMSLLHWACDRGYEEMVGVLLRHKADINVKDIDGQTPLHYGVCCEHSSIVRLLLSRGADTSAIDSSGVRACECSDNPDILALFS